MQGMLPCGYLGRQKIGNNTQILKYMPGATYPAGSASEMRPAPRFHYWRELGIWEQILQITADSGPRVMMVDSTASQKSLVVPEAGNPDCSGYGVTPDVRSSLYIK